MILDKLLYKHSFFAWPNIKKLKFKVWVATCRIKEQLNKDRKKCAIIISLKTVVSNERMTLCDFRIRFENCSASSNQRISTFPDNMTFWCMNFPLDEMLGFFIAEKCFQCHSINSITLSDGITIEKRRGKQEEKIETEKTTLTKKPEEIPLMPIDIFYFHAFHAIFFH